METPTSQRSSQIEEYGSAVRRLVRNAPPTVLGSFDIEVPTAVPIAVELDRTVFLIVDLENEFCHPEGLAYQGREAEEAVAATAALAARVRSGGGRVAWIRSLRAPDAPEFTAFGVAPHLLEGSWAVQFSDPLTVEADDVVFEKRSHDPFNATGLGAWLAGLGVTAPDLTVLVAGVALDVCVHHAILGLSVRHHNVGVVLDCVAPRTGSRAAAGLATLAGPAYAYNVTITSSELLRC